MNNGDKSDNRTPEYDVASIMGALYGDGITASRGAFERTWVEQLREDIDALFAEALSYPGGAVGRGPNDTMSRFIRSAFAALSTS